VPIVLAAVFGIVVLGMAVALANAASTARVAENATLLHWTNATRGTAALARSAVGQAVIFGLGNDQGHAEDDAMARAVAEAEEALAEFATWVERTPGQLTGANPELVGVLDEFAAAGGQVVNLVTTGRPGDAQVLRESLFEQVYVDVAELVGAQERNVTNRIARNEDAAAVVAQGTEVVVTLLIPGLALVVYWLVSRRQVREKELELHGRLAAERDVVAGISHELRTPLTAIYGLSEILLDDPLPPAEAADLVRMINAESAELARMVEDLITAARIDTGAMLLATDVFDPEVEIASVLMPFRRGGHPISVQCTAGTLVGDAEAFRQIIRNLVANAVHHGGAGIVVGDSVGDGWYRCSISDDGPGVRPEVVGELFTAFVNRGERSVLSGSVGLGLAVSKATAEAMGGDLSYERAEGWTTFTLTVPARPDDAGPRPLDEGVATSGAAAMR
jgi:signal transduction histidine kinase